MVPVSFHDFFSGCATVAGALIGLLFVALSVSQEKLTGDDARAEHQVRAGAAFSALVNTLVMALVALLPGASLGQAGIIVAAAGLATTSGLVIVLYREHQQKMYLGDVSMLTILSPCTACSWPEPCSWTGLPAASAGSAARECS